MKIIFALTNYNHTNIMRISLEDLVIRLSANGESADTSLCITQSPYWHI